MSIFGKIKDAIFGKGGGPLGDNYLGHSNNRRAEAPAAPNPAPAPAAPSAPAAPQATSSAAAQPQAAPAAAAPVDVEAALMVYETERGTADLNWRTSIVDLMKLLGLDSSLENRKELAEELGYTGARDGSAEMNIWLHKAVMRELEKNGGKVSESLRG